MDRKAAIYAAFVEHAWNPDAKRFRNFMGFDRRWLEDTGSDDSCGRTVWALATAATSASDPDTQRIWARGLYERVIEPLAELQSPRAQAFMMLGTAAIAQADPADDQAAASCSRGGAIT